MFCQKKMTCTHEKILRNQIYLGHHNLFNTTQKNCPIRFQLWRPSLFLRPFVFFSRPLETDTQYQNSISYFT